MRLSVLDQSPIISGHDAPRAIAETLALARRADELGYERYWLAGHHAIPALGHPCPEGRGAPPRARTPRVRIGTRGVVLPHASALPLPEAMRTPVGLFPARLDL